jgi:hypothetical protein
VRAVVSGGETSAGESRASEREEDGRTLPGKIQVLPLDVHLSQGYARSHLIFDSAQGTHDLRRERLLYVTEMIKTAQ